MKGVPHPEEDVADVLFLEYENIMTFPCGYLIYGWACGLPSTGEAGDAFSEVMCKLDKGSPVKYTLSEIIDVLQLVQKLLPMMKNKKRPRVLK
ncbi:MAG: hypothetical protein NZS48_08820 [Gemmata sp.]|nr:hypothetical protein [Gemmata sp.]